MAEFRNIIANGDLIREKVVPSWWFFSGKKWAPYRNLSREVRYLEERMHSMHAMYRQAQEDFVVAQKNVNMDRGFLHKHKVDNSEVVYEIPSDESILERREGVKYSTSRNNNGNKQNNGNGNNQQKQQQNQRKGNAEQKKPQSLLAFLADAKITLH